MTFVEQQVRRSGARPAMEEEFQSGPDESEAQITHDRSSFIADARAFSTIRRHGMPDFHAS